MPIKQNTQVHSIPGDQQDGRSSFVHRAIVSSAKLGKLTPQYLILLWIALFFLTYYLWQNSILILFISIGILCVDWVILGLLPVHNRSWGPVTPPLFSLTLARIGLRIILGLLLSNPWDLMISTLFDVTISVVTLYATWIEPFNIVITRLRLHLPAEFLSQELSILHISDIHYEGVSLREERLLEIVNSESPDVIFLTGDYLNLSSVYDVDAQHGVNKLLSHLNAPLGVYAVSGSPAVDQPGIMPNIFAGLSLHWLQDKVSSLSMHGIRICIMGLVNTYNEDRDIDALHNLVSQLPDDCFSILLYHTPDLMPVATELGVNLYLCGHTHGGQISLPLYGALVTSSKYGKRYERGLFQKKNTRLYVSRGLGMEGMGAPRARFCSSPEVILWTLVPESEHPLTESASIV